MNIISEFNDTLTKWIKYQNYKNIEIYIDREHVLNRFADESRSSKKLILYYNINILKYLIKKFLKNNFDQLDTLISKQNPQSFFFSVKLNISDIDQYLYFTGELQFNKIKKCFQFCVSTFLPNICDDHSYIPTAAANDIIVNLIY